MMIVVMSVCASCDDDCGYVGLCFMWW
jgi:hypothetical protein